MKVIRYIEAGKNVKYIVPKIPNSITYFLIAVSDGLTVINSLMIPTIKIRKPSNLKPIII